MDLQTAAALEVMLTKLAPGLLSKMATSLQRSVDAIRVRILDTFGEHLKFTLDRCETVKTIISDESPVNLRDIYINLDLQIGSEIIRDYNLSVPPAKYRAFIIRGTAGAGKTMLMKYLALEAFANSVKLPIFIDLRDIGDPREKAFIRSIYSLATPERSNKDFDLFNAGLRFGLFWFFFDGLDEVNPAYRETTFRQIQRFPFDYPDVQMTISSRPETETAAFSIFSVLTLQNMNAEQAVSLIEKTNYHDPVKKMAFMDLLANGLFQEKESFASNPLLCLLMLMTFGDNGEIPDQAANFYERAFDTLYIRHDSSKGPFKRIYRTGLSKTAFKRVFGIFCYRTLARHQISFDEMDLRREFERAIDIADEQCSADDLVRDCLEAVCVLQKDGGKIHFIHRSFQEFFAADFLAGYREPDLFETVDQLLSDSLGTKVAPLLYDLNSRVLEEAWILPMLERTIERLKAPEEAENPARAFRNFVSTMEISDKTGKITSVSWKSAHNLSQFLGILDLIYPDAEFSDRGLSMVGVRMYPKNYRTFRAFLNRGALVPPAMKKKAAAAERAKKKAYVERKAMLRHAITSWTVELEDESVDEWLEATDLVARIPAALAALERLRDAVKTRVLRRKGLKLLS